jgi:hypothetical protein
VSVPDGYGAPNGARAPEVVVVDADGTRRAPISLTTAGLTAGRIAPNDLILEDPLVSRNHLRIDWDGTQATVTDLGSSNGTTLGNTRLLPHVGQPWNGQDWLIVGPYWLQLVLPERSRAQLPQPQFDPVAAGGQPGTAERAVAPTDPGALAGKPAEVESSRVRVVLEQNTLTITPGQPAIVKLTLANHGSIVDWFTVIVEGLPPGWVKTPEREIQLNPGAQAPAVLQVIVARVAENRSGEYPVTIRARSRENPSESGAAVALWTVLPFTAGGIALEPTRASGRSGATYDLSIHNQSNSPAHYQLSGKDEEQALQFSFDPPTVSLEPAGTATVPVKVQAQRKWIGSSVSRRFTVQAATTTGDGPPQTVNGELVHKAYIPKWLPPILAVAGAAAAFFIWNMLQTEPVIREVSVSPLPPEQGQPFTISWNVQDADTVQIAPVASPVPATDGKMEFPDGSMAALIDEIVACDDDKCVSKPIEFVVTELTPTPTQAPGEPDIVKFEVNPTGILQPGQTVTIEWEVDDVENLEIQPFGTIDELKGSRQEQIFQTRTYSLRATNGSNTVTRNIEVLVFAPTATATATPTQTATPTVTPVDTATATATATATGTAPATNTPVTPVTGGGDLKMDNDDVRQVVMGNADGSILYSVTGSDLYRSDNAGRTWNRVGSNPDGTIISALNNPQHLYAGDEGNQCDIGRLSDTPLVRSTNGGASFDDEFNEGFRALLAFTGQNSLVVGTDCRLQISTTGGTDWSLVNGIEGNLRVVSAASNEPDLSGIIAVTLEDTNPDTNYVGYVYFIDMADPEFPEIINSFSLYAESVVAWAGDAFVLATPEGTARIGVSRDEGIIFFGFERNGVEDVTFPPNIVFFGPPQGSDTTGFSDIVVDPDDTDRVWLSGKTGVFLSDDGGDSWDQIVESDDEVDDIAVSIDADQLYVTTGNETKVYTLDGN